MAFILSLFLKSIPKRSGLSSLMILLVSLAVPTLQAQQFNFRTFTTREGLANNSVREIAIDSSGFLWAATWDGISRYDGYEFKNYYHIPADSASLPYFALKDLAVDGTNNLWVVTDMGQLVLYDRIKDNFTRIKEVPFPKEHRDVNIDVDKYGNLWIITENRIIKRDCRSGEFEYFSVYEEESTYFNPSENFRINIINDREMWLSGTNLYHLTRRSSKDSQEQILIIDNEYRIFHSLIRPFTDYFERQWSELYISPKGNKWFLSNFGLFRFEKDNEFREFNSPIPEGEFTGNRLFVWGSAENGLYIYNPASGLTENIKNEALPFALAYLQVNRNLLWFSARSVSGNTLGLVQVMVSPVIFRNYQAESGILSSEAVYAIYKDRSGTIWVGIRGRDYIHLIKPDGSTGKTGQIYPETMDNVGHLRTFAEVKDGIWLGYYLNRLEFYDFATRKFTIYTPDAPIYFHTILPDDDGTLLIATNQIYKFYPKTRRSASVWSRNDDDYSIYRLIRDSNGILWAGSKNNFLIRINPADWTGTLIRLGDDEYNLEDICVGDNKDLWIASLGGGVCNYKPLTGEMKFYTTANGLSNNTTYSIKKDGGGYIWVSTNNGISRIDPRTKLIKVFNISDGLNIIEFNSDASFVAEDGEFFFGGVGGIASFYPDRLQDFGTSFIKQKVLITKITVSGITKHFRKAVNDSDTIILQKGENNFMISFSSSDFVNSEKTKYRFLLKGINNDWVETSYRDRSVNFANLRPGWYDFAIQATDGNREWCKPKYLKIRVMPFFYQTKMFTLFFPILLIGLIAASMFLYVRNLRHSQSRKLDALRLQTLRGQMNPHFVFNSLNSINYFISKNDKLSANRYIADFSKLIRSILYNMNNDFITLDKEIESLTDYLKIEYLRFGDKFEYDITIDSDIEPDRYRVSPGLVQPFIENAIWHGMRGLENRKGRITLIFSRLDGKTRCIVEDDGIGRKKAEKVKSAETGNKSHGISIVLERLKIINNLMSTDFQIAICDCYPDKQETGTRVIIDLPVIPN